MIVGFSGYLRSGKDTAAQVLIEDGFEHRSFAKALKDMAYALNPIVDGFGTRLQDVVDRIGWEKAKDTYPEIRALLQRMGTDAGRKVLGDNIWVDTAMKDVYECDRSVVFTDVRFPNEADAIQARGGVVIRIERPGFRPGPDAHVSETALDSFPFDEVIVNDGTVDALRDAVRGTVSYFEEQYA